MRVIWTKDIRPPSTAPLDRHFLGIPRGKTQPIDMVWDAEMNCFLCEDFAMADYLSGWIDCRASGNLARQDDE